MSKPVKNMIVESYRRRFGEVDGAVVIDLRGVESPQTTNFRGEMAQNGVKITIVRNALARRAWSGGPLEPLGSMLEGSCAIVYGDGQELSVVNVARMLIDQAKKIENMQFKGALMEGVLFGPDQVEELSKYPTREEAQAQALQIVLSPGRNLAGAIAGPGGKLASIIKTIQEKLEEGQTIGPA